MEQSKRHWGIDCMRIVCMLFIVLYHIQGHGGLVAGERIASVNRTIVIMLQCVYQVAIDGFALISGYTGCNSRQRYASLATLWLRVLFYSVGLTGAVWLMLPGEVSYACIRDAFFPLITGQYWYFTAYAGCFVLVPLVRSAMEHMPRREAKRCLTGIVLVFSVLPYLRRNDPFMTTSGSHALWLLILYALGAYVRKYNPFARIPTAGIALLFAGACAVQSCSGYVMQALSGWLTGKPVTWWYFICNDSPTTLVLALLMLELFSRLRTRRRTPLFRVLVSGSFSVYLMHDHPLIREHVIVPFGAWLASLPSSLLLPAVFTSAIGIYLFCACVDMIREGLFGVLRIRARLDRLEEKLLATDEV